ncbi:hypothetical protein MWU75_11620 [Ornithinimicrobium sp. F0845]|uniref:hypothetical protein n=1 Tax=Ornithinimicrobium sp. F0845 TaxID=2926412 RepID=UPI001FF56E68|nr:hypothetical protein [Ornithinimicrobium sp. F0845]MCK0112789.1 hypothetical protein [Ornithinimicrobium sp. F0845]
MLDTDDSDILEGWTALRLDRESSLSLTGELPEGIDLSAISAADVSLQTASFDGSRETAADGGAVLDGWVCRCFPRLPGCR